MELLKTSLFVTPSIYAIPLAIYTEISEQV